MLVDNADDTRLAEARVALTDAEEAERAASDVVTFDAERAAIGEITRAQLQASKVKLARAHEATEAAKALVRAIERAGLQEREAAARLGERARQAAKVEAVNAARELEAEFGSWLVAVETELEAFDARVLTLGRASGGLSPLRKFTDTRAGMQLAAGLAFSRRLWPARKETP